jgi:hypothetical protein
MITTGPSPSRLVDERAHFRDAGLQPCEDRLADQEVSDVQLLELRDRCDRDNIVEGEAVPGMRLDAVLDGERGRSGNPAQLLRSRLALECA